MSIGENAPSASDSVGRGEEWNMESPQEHEVNEAEVDSPEEGDEDVPYMSDREKMGDVYVCGLGKPGEKKLEFREESSVRIISKEYKESLRESTPDALHEGVIRALGELLEVPGFGERDEEEPTEEQLERLEELYRKVVEREESNRSIFEKIVRSPKVWGAFAGVLAAAAAISVGAMIGKTELGDGKMGNDEAVAILEEYKNSLSANEVEDVDDMGGVTIDEIDEIIAAANQSPAE